MSSDQTDLTETSNGGQAVPPAASRNPKGLLLAAAAGVLVLAMAGIGTGVYLNSSDDRAPTPTASTVTLISPSTTPTPTPTSPRDLAIAAAEKTYRQYIEVTDRLGKAGYSNTLGLEKVAIQEELMAQHSLAVHYKSAGLHQVGDTQITSMTVRGVDLTTDPSIYKVPEVTLRVCLDNSKLYAANESGANVRPSDLPTHSLEKVWVRYYPKYGGVDGWFVARSENSLVASC